MESRYFVTIIAEDQAALRRLGNYELDLLHQTAAVTERRAVRLMSVKDKARPNEFVEAGPAGSTREFAIDGLLDLAQIGRLVEDGYQVLVREGASKRSNANLVIDFQDWLKAVLEG